MPDGSRVRYKIYYGGRDSAKSHSIAEALIRRTAAVPTRVLCTREYQNSIKDSVHRLLVDKIGALGLTGWFDVTEKAIKSKVGSEFMFKGLHNNVQEIKSTEGIDICWNEEAHFTSDESWKTLIPTIRKDGSEIWASFNVTDEDAPTHQRFVINTPPDTLIHHVNYWDNPFLTETSKKEIAYLKANDYAAYEHVYEGRPLKISEAVIFGGRYRVDAFPDDLYQLADRLFFGGDWGFSQDPSALVRYFIYNKKLFIEYEAFGVGREFAGKKKIIDGVERGELEQLWLEVPGSLQWPIKADSARPETISFMRGCGFNVSPADKWEGCVEDGISHIKGFDEIIIHPRCKHMIQEARLYSFKRDKVTGQVLPDIIDKNNHGWDSIRYGLDGYIQRRGILATWAKLGKR
jgi:phage terminase large subunit